jgi:hypothetical protein
MKSIYGITGFVFIFLLIAVNTIMTPEAQAFRGRGAAFAVGAAVGSAGASASEAEAAAAQQQAAAAQQQAALAQQQAALAQQAAQRPASAPGEPFPLGTVVSALPAGCTSTPVGGVNYYYCGGNFYKAVYEGSTLKYVTTKPE